MSRVERLAGRGSRALRNGERPDQTVRAGMARTGGGGKSGIEFLTLLSLALFQ